MATADAPSSGRERVQVVVRCRPMSHRELVARRRSCVKVFTRQNRIEVRGPGRRGPIDTGVRVFEFDRVYDKCSQQQLYQEVAHPVVESVMHGYNGTVLAYGQTASGKTYTMEGFDDQPEYRGIIPSAFQDIFSYIARNQSSTGFLVRASFLEIYNEEIRDLLVPGSSASAKLELIESADVGIFVKNLTCRRMHSLSDILHLLMVGKKNRSVGATLMNQDSSRSHSIFTVTVEASYVAENDPGKRLHIRVGKLHLVDLAGSERMSKAGAKGKRFRELTNINWSLMALGNVISALADGKNTHIPYRDSKLTRLLQDSLGGNAKTVMIANIGPSEYNYEETVSTLRYANRARSIRNAPRINQDPKSALLGEEILRLKAQLSDDTRNAGVEHLDPREFSEKALALMRVELEPQLKLTSLATSSPDKEKEELTERLLQQLKRIQGQNKKARVAYNPQARPWMYRPHRPGNAPLLRVSVYKKAPPQVTRKSTKNRKNAMKNQRIPCRLADARQRAVEVRHRNFYI